MYLAYTRTVLKIFGVNEVKPTSTVLVYSSSSYIRVCIKILGKFYLFFVRYVLSDMLKSKTDYFA